MADSVRIRMPVARRHSSRAFGFVVSSEESMICTRCQEREATVHITEIEGEVLRKVDLCEACCQVSRPELWQRATHSSSYPPPRTRGQQGTETK
jgi:hypothetical protein